MKRFASVSALIAAFLVCGAVGSYAGMALRLPSECMTIPDNLTHWSPACEAAKAHAGKVGN